MTRGSRDGRSTGACWLAYLVLVLIIVSVPGCGRNDNTRSGVAGRTVITVWHPWGGPTKERFEALVTEFNRGNIKTILATNTLSEGVNTPADIVIVFGTRRGSYYLDTVDVNQMFGRAGRGKDEATAYLIGDKIGAHCSLTT